MLRLLARAAAPFLIAAALVAGTALPAAAYPPDDATRVSETSIAPGGTVQLSVADGTFSPGEGLTITVSGENASGVTFALVRTAVETLTYTDAVADADGGLAPLTVRFPQNASGPYTIAVFSPSSPGDSVTVTVGSLSSTGLNAQSLLGIWVGGGALVLAGVIVLLAVVIARRRRAADAA